MTWMELEGVMLSEISRERQFPFHIVKETLLFSNTEIIHCHYGTTYFYFPFLNLFKESETFFFFEGGQREREKENLKQALGPTQSPTQGLIS